MPVNECLALYKPGQDVPFKASAAVTGKTFVAPSGNRTGGGLAGLSTVTDNVYTCAKVAAAGKACGVARYDVASGALGAFTAEGIVPVTAGANITAGQEVEADAAGKAIPLASGKSLGVAMTGASSGADAEIKLMLG